MSKSETHRGLFIMATRNRKNGRYSATVHDHSAGKTLFYLSSVETLPAALSACKRRIDDIVAEEVENVWDGMVAMWERR